MMDLSNMSMNELRQLLEKTRLELKNREQQDLAKAREEILAIASKVGIPLRELLVGGIRVGTGKVAVRYRHPGNDAQQWTGRGRQPKWVKAWVDAGQPLDQLRV
jgi:DNA-binding protein H-NS